MKQNKKSTQVKFDKFNDLKIDETTAVVGGNGCDDYVDDDFGIVVVSDGKR